MPDPQVLFNQIACINLYEIILCDVFHIFGHVSRIVGPSKCPADITGCIPHIGSNREIASSLIILQRLQHDRYHWRHNDKKIHSKTNAKRAHFNARNLNIEFELKVRKYQVLFLDFTAYRYQFLILRVNIK